MLFKKFPEETKELDDMRDKVKAFRDSSFHEEWIKKVLPMLNKKEEIKNKLQWWIIQDIQKNIYISIHLE